MPWIETEPMNEKIKFISAYLSKDVTFQALCEQFKISRKTGYKYINRYKSEGVEGLKDQSRAPHTQANQTDPEIEESILHVKSIYPRWGAKKLLNKLEQDHADIQWPSRSTIDELLKKHGLVIPRKRKRQVAPYTQPLKHCQKPNDVWSIDYKGQFALGNKDICYPLTISDNFSRYILGINGTKGISNKITKKILRDVFCEFGLPKAIRSDNGVPFAGNSIGGLSPLAIWLIKLGIVPERIRKGHPEENGRHERMHFTLKQEVASPPQFNYRKQQNCFNKFRKMFNEERPHEGIDFNRPAWLYKPSTQAYKEKLTPVEYDTALCEVRLVRPNGHIKWKGREVFISSLLAGEPIALRPCSLEEWIIYFSFLPLGIYNERMHKVDKM